MATATQQKTVHANFVKVAITEYLDDGTTSEVVIAEGQTLSANETTGLSDVRVIRNIEAEENIHNAYGVRFSIATLVWKSSEIERYRLGRATLYHIPEFDLIASNDEEGGAPLFTLKRCTIGDRSLSINANQPIQSNVQGSAITIEDA